MRTMYTYRNLPPGDINAMFAQFALCFLEPFNETG